MIKKRYEIHTWVINPLIFLLFLLTAISAAADETYIFERMWPTLQQPWYFENPHSIAFDDAGNVYIADFGNIQICKFNQDGAFITRWTTSLGEPRYIATDDAGNLYVTHYNKNRVSKYSTNGVFIRDWGGDGSEGGQLNNPWGLVVDFNDNVYVVDSGNHRICKFSPNGSFIAAWGGLGSGDGQLNEPKGISIDSIGNIYVADTQNHRICKFSSTGIFIDEWGTERSGDEQFDRPYDVAIDIDGNIYVADTRNTRICKLNPNGGIAAKWGSFGAGNVEFLKPIGVAIDRRQRVYVADELNDRIQIFSNSGAFFHQWASVGSADGRFRRPRDVAVDDNGRVYVADTENHRIQVFSENGLYLDHWGAYGSGDEQFDLPSGIALGANGNVFVADSGNNRILVFSPDGTFVDKWGSEGSEDGQLDNPIKIAIDNEEYIYVVDSGNHRICKFSSSGNFIARWGNEGSGDGQFIRPTDMAIGSSGDIYVVDGYNHRIQVFTKNGTFIETYGGLGTGDGQFIFPDGIALDGNGNIYVTDNWSYLSRIQKFAPDWQFLQIIGERGTSPGQYNGATGLWVTKNDRIYFADTLNNRLQSYREVTLDDRSKAIIVAGGGPYPGNNLWDVTRMCANFAYRALNFQGFSKDAIYYLTSDTELDLDNNGVLDDVDADATNGNLKDAISNWANDAENLILYLVDHGGDGSFRMSAEESLSASDLDAWLDQLQQTISGKAIVIYDACESGSFLSTLLPPADKERIVVTSTSPNESAYFVSQGALSFSNFFWTHIFNGLNLFDAFRLTLEAMGMTVSDQIPLLDANRNGVGNEAGDIDFARNTTIGNGTQILGDSPVIEQISPEQTISGISSALIYATGVTDDDGIARVWAVIRPPDYYQSSPDNPVQDFPAIDLLPVGEDRYEQAYNDFNLSGTYQIVIYARDRTGNTSIPELTTVTVDNPMRRRAIIVAGGSHADALWPTVEKSAGLAYRALKFQGYSDDDLYFLSPVTFTEGVDGSTTLNNLDYALNIWSTQNTQDMVLYLVGSGSAGTFQVNEIEALSVGALDVWLDNLQTLIPGTVTVIYDACQSGSFLPSLTPPNDKRRISIASTGQDQPAAFISEGDISFSNFFWNGILNGTNVRDAFLHAMRAIEFTSQVVSGGPILARLDDDGNGLANQRDDGRLSRRYTIGLGILLAGNDPIIGSVSPQQTIGEGETASIWAEDVATTGELERVWAVVTPRGLTIEDVSTPLTELPCIELIDTGSGRYEGTCNEFSYPGAYRIVIYAMDSEGNISLPREVTVCYKDCGTAEIKRFITRLYQLCLNREPDQSGLDGWVRALVYGMLTGGDVACGFVLSEEFLDKNTTNEEFLQILYAAFFDRAPDITGWQGWLNALTSGASREDVLNGFIYAAEFANYCDEFNIQAFKGHTSIFQREAVEDFVARFYRRCLGREPDQSELEGWTNSLLHQIQSGADVAEGFIYSPEFIGRNTTNSEYLEILYKALLDRDSDPAGWNSWLVELDAGRDRGEVLNGFLYSQEFVDLAQRFGIKAFDAAP
jgi:sugar lactone lactonase YvrE